MRLFIELSYDGASFHGWQRQPESSSVQEEIEKQLTQFLGERVPVMGCGRTDTGVHASYFVAHCDWPIASDRAKRYRDWEEAAWKLNGMLPPQIAIHRMVPVHPRAHARFDAIERGYIYRMHQAKDPFLLSHSARIYRETDFQKMQEACRYLVRKGDFAAFCKLGSNQGTTICDLREAKMVQINEREWQFEIRADRFLRNMVRAIVGTLLDVGQGRREPEEMEAIMASGLRSEAGKSAPANGLFLSQVRYPDSIWSSEESTDTGSN